MSSLRPGDFPIGSALSRAAGETALEKSPRHAKARNSYFQCLLAGAGNENEPHVGPWQDFGDTLMRFIYQPSVWLKPGDAIPSCPSCGTSFKKENEYASMISYTANCLDLHDPQIIGKRN